MHYTRVLRYGDHNIVMQHKLKGVRYKMMPEYNVWSNLKARCYKKNNNQFHNYGGRGIKVCKEWLHNFPQFLEDMGNRPNNKYKIDRIDNDGDYSKNNCRWVTNKVNCNNTRFNKRIIYKGINKTYSEWSSALNGNKHLIHDRIKMGWGEERAVTEHVRHIKNTYKEGRWTFRKNNNLYLK
jgi:hypothetical protein